MKKIRKVIWIPILAVVAAVAIVIMVLSLVKINPVMDNFGGYERVELYVSSDGNEAGDIDDNGVNVVRQALDSGLKSSEFSYMHAMLEGTYSYGLKLKTTKDGEGNTVNATVMAKEIETYGPAESQYVVKLYYNEARTVKVQGVKIVYDRVLIRLFESNGEVVNVECVPYLDANIGNEIPDREPDENGVMGSEYYEANIVYVKMNTSRIMLNIKEIKDKYEI